MGSSYQKSQEQKKEDAADADWFVERMAALVSELKLLKEPLRAAFVRGCLNAAMRQHARISNVGLAPVDDYEDQ